MPVLKLISRTQRDAINAVVERALAVLAVDPPLLFPDWADAEFYLSPESSGVQGPWTTIAPQRGLMLLMAHEDLRQFTFRKCARIGYTKMLVAAMAYWTAHRPRNGVIFQPVKEDSDGFVQEEINPMLRDCPQVRDRMKGNPEKSGKGNTLAIKTFDGCIWHFRGGKAAAAYRRLTKDIVIYDELDGFDRDIEGTGDPVTLGDKRVTASPFKKSIRGSTPEDAGTSIIQATLDTARLVFEWHFLCIHCVEFVAFHWADLHWTDRDSEPYGVCPSCAGIWHFTDLRVLNEGGRWQTIAGDMHYVDNATGDIRDAGNQVIDMPLHVGAVAWSGWSPFITWRELRDEFMEAKPSPPKLKAFVNTRLGECWTEGTKPGWETLHARRAQFPAGFEKQICIVTMGIDVQDDRFEWQITGWCAGEVSYSLGYGRLFVRTDTPEAFDRLFEMHNRLLIVQNRAFPIAVVAIDSGHRTDEVYRICRKAPRQWIPVKGASDAHAPVAAFPRTRGKVHRTYLTPVGVSQIKSILYGHFVVTEGEGLYHWPVDDAHNTTYFQQLVSEEKRVKYVKGKPQIEWWKSGGVGNEALDCNVYAYAGMKIAVDYLGADLTPPPADVVAPVAAPAQQWLKRKDGTPWLRGR